jgi:hypothetical protein
MRAEGFVTISRIVDAGGKLVSPQKAVDYGWVVPEPGKHCGWGLDRSEIPLGRNLFVDQGRQLMAYAFANRSPAGNFTCQRFAVGTGTTAAKVIDVALESPVTLASGQNTGPIDSIDFLSAFVIRVAFTLGIADANGFLLTEQALLSGNNTLIARKIRSVGINKTSDFSPTLTWRIRF